MIRDLVAASVRLATGVRSLPGIPGGRIPAIFYANHSSHMDFVVVWSALPAAVRAQTCPVAAEDYWGTTAWRRRIVCEWFRGVLVSRTHVSRAHHPLDRLDEVLAEGRSIILFPEGTRGTTGEIGEFRSGLFHLAKRHPGIPLIPVQLENLSRILPKGARLPVPLIAQARFQEPIHLREGEAKAAFLSRARAALEDTR